jgi:hypothetical protein
MSRIDGSGLRIGGRLYRVDAETVTCGGEGRGTVTRGTRRWTHFTCLQPTFPSPGTAGPDVVFRVHPTGRRRFIASDARLTRY